VRLRRRCSGWTCRSAAASRRTCCGAPTCSEPRGAPAEAARCAWPAATSPSPPLARPGPTPQQARRPASRVLPFFSCCVWNNLTRPRQDERPGVSRSSVLRPLMHTCPWNTRCCCQIAMLRSASLCFTVSCCGWATSGSDRRHRDGQSCNVSIVEQVAAHHARAVLAQVHAVCRSPQCHTMRCGSGQ